MKRLILKLLLATLSHLMCNAANILANILLIEISLGHTVLDGNLPLITLPICWLVIFAAFQLLIVVVYRVKPLQHRAHKVVFWVWSALLSVLTIWLWFWVFVSLTVAL